MPALIAGAVAPDFTLPSLDGAVFSLQDALRGGPVVAAFFKISCPVCQFAFPYIERLHQAYKGKNVTIVGVSQNGDSDTKAFLREYGITFPVLLDDRSRYLVSNAYGLANVPTLFLISQSGEIEQSIVGWDRSEMERLNQRIAPLIGPKQAQLFRPGEDVPEFKAG